MRLVKVIFVLAVGVVASFAFGSAYAATTLPVGSIITSILTPADFAKQMPNGETWELADGATVVQGQLRTLIQNNSEYKALNESNVAHKPDLRGVFLRGKNANRKDGLGNPNNQELDVGSYQADDVGPHIHSQIVGYPDGGYSGQGSAWHDRGADNTKGPTPEAGHDRLETRPRNVTVYYYLRTK